LLGEPGTAPPPGKTAPRFQVPPDPLLMPPPRKPRWFPPYPSLRSLAISVLRLDGHANIAAANRHHARDPQRMLQLLQTA